MTFSQVNLLFHCSVLKQKKTKTNQLLVEMLGLVFTCLSVLLSHSYGNYILFKCFLQLSEQLQQPASVNMRPCCLKNEELTSEISFFL